MKSDFAFNRPRTIVPPRALELRPEIEAFHAEYCAVLDANDVERWPDFFTEDALYRMTARENADLGLPVGLVYCEGRDMMRDRAVAISRTADVRAALHAARAGQHPRGRRRRRRHPIPDGRSC